jgi:hypothetical protein
LLNKAANLLSSGSRDLDLDTAADLERAAVEIEQIGGYEPERGDEQRDLAGGG